MTLSTHAVQRAAVYWIFPGLVFAMVAGNEGWRIGPLLLGQTVSWVNDAAALALVLGRFRSRRWVRVLITATLAAKAATIAGLVPALSDLAFDVGLCLLFCAAGAIVMSERPGIAYRQLLLIAILSIPVMVVQMTGTVPATEALNTEHTEDPPGTQPTLFVPEADLHYRTAQARPSGLMHSNNFLSLIAVFAVALHFSRLRTGWLTWRDVAVTAFALLTMAKVSLLIFSAVVLWKLVTGARLERSRMVRVGTFALAFLGAYKLFFPGLFVANTNSYKLTYSFFVRANDFVAMLPEGTTKAWLLEQLSDTPRASAAAVGLSGYAQIFSALPYLVLGAIVFVPAFFKGFRNLKRRYPDIVDTTVLTLFVIILYPTAVPMFRAQIFWFIAGFALLPFFIVWEPRRFTGPVGHLWQRSFRRQATGGLAS